MKQTDKDHLQWIHDRIVNVYGENENVDFLIKMREIISNVNVYDNTKDEEPYSISIPPEILYKKPSWLETLIFGLYKKYYKRK
jgi:hypothetical protein